MKRELLVGCGKNIEKQLSIHGDPEWHGLTTLDINPEHKPDIVWDLNILPLPFSDETFDEIHAYEVLEHLGSQGDYKSFFGIFSEFYRLLKPDGFVMATVPSIKSVWAWGDPSHTRVITPQNLIFLNQTAYYNVGQRDPNTGGIIPISDFRSVYKADFDVVYCEDNNEANKFVLRKIYPSRLSYTEIPAYVRQEVSTGETEAVQGV